MTGAKRTSGPARFLTLLHKELLEQLRSMKLVWVPLVFILLGIMQPVTSYYMPVIIEKAGNLPEGTVIEMPMPSGVQVLADTLSQFGFIGALVLVLVFMGIVSGERNSGASALVLVKPISFGAYIGSKWIGMLLLTWGSLLLGYLAAWYYTSLLIETVNMESFLGSFAIYGLWFTFIMTLTLLFSVWLKSAGGAAFSALGLAVLLSLLAGLMPKYLGWSPGSLSGYAIEALLGGINHTVRFGWTIGLTILIISACLLCAVAFLRRSPALD